MALIDINMMPWDVLEKTTRFRHIRFWAKCLMLVIFFLGISYGVLHQWMAVQKKQGPSQVSAGRDPVASKMMTIRQLQDQIQAIQEKNRSLSALVRGQLFFDIMGTFSSCLNDETWITALSIQQDPEKSDTARLECEGTSWNHHSLGLFLNRLSQTPRIRQVVLGNAHNTDGTLPAAATAGAEFPGAVRFKISATMRGLSDNDPSN
ncbi:PilN domain-containing protein [Desulfobacula sp.]|uniref:PilN domain-containing protein n=1 Tax=Desulfobacula sp. TaxID=2593537 RepID=UPI00260EFC6D|nr:PilN domain-containing protein [Desulfobacula sp.]